MFEADFVSCVAVVTASAALSAGLIFLLKPLLGRHLLSHPNERSSHKTATPEGAGYGVMGALLAVCVALLLFATMPPPSLIPVLVGAAVLTAVGGLDDAHALAVSSRLLAQALVALGVVLLLSPDFRLLPDLLPLGVERALLVIGVVGFVNAINFLDGLDWMTVAQVVPMTLGAAILCGLGVVPVSIGVLALALLGAMLGFAVFNKHPAQIFLGDAGSLPIGLVLAYVLIYVAEAHIVSAILLALYTLADATVTLFRRLRNGERVFSAHRSHFYQRAVTQGLRVPQVTTRVFWLGLWLMTLAIAAALARTLAVDISAFLMGLAGVWFVLFNFSRGR
ncbi:MAG: glycosyl transferase [Methyloceanibacter sp.]|uniref:glycosyl transferase n=1 Tax=Methyloceanibacter sp. TaxID=1965321 RepID=UPI003EE09146